ncbi:glycoside hydrolase family 43 protein [Macroventuria anomochaeta]|uniref:Glycoside hydrolase family 43 protein n=1 Tax=Macroventuria anomochaeta TaxID=301207 RepID=A0ACB6RHY9_9PLEO|nr:glycoside hydrolase family 43 protein [Macroventuria anomochaeta]KAF2621358.1 glycoside hydrolase family 43 protein [Macroventuria anomochaeta]
MRYLTPGIAQDPFICYLHTGDFKTFTAPARWNTDASATVTDQEIQHLGNRPYVRYLSNIDTMKRVVLDRSDDGLFGTWKRVGVPVDKLHEDPASYQDILRPQRFYLWEDDYGGAVYECYTEDFTVPYEPCTPGLTPWSCYLDRRRYVR